MDKVRCQECGGELKISMDGELNVVEHSCTQCGEIGWPKRARLLRARKKFELVKACIGSAAEAHPGVHASDVVDTVDKMLTELYGSAP